MIRHAIAGTIEFALTNFTLVLLVAGLLAAALSLLRSGDRSRAAVTEALLRCFIFFSIGVSYSWNFVVHSLLGDYSARIIGWPQSPFQLEVAFASLGFALLAFYAARRRASIAVQLTPILASAPFLWGAAAGHIHQIVTTGNLSAGNAGIVLYTDIALPIIGVTLLVARGRSARRPASIEEPDSGISRRPLSTPDHATV